MSTEYQQLIDADLQPYPKVNANNASLGQAWTFSFISASGFVVRIGGGAYAGSDRTGASLTCVNGTNYIVAARSDGALTVATSTDWDNTTTYGRVGVATFASGVLTGFIDWRHEPGGAFRSSASSALNVQSVTSASTVTPTFANDLVNITEQAASLTLANPSGTAVEGWGIVIRIKDNGTARTIAYGTQYRAIGVTLPTTTVISKTLYLACVWNDTDTKIDIVAVGQEA